MLCLENICVNYSYKSVLKGVSISFLQGKIYSLLGENGAGKSTLAKVICGDISPTSGQILLNSTQVSFNSPKDAILAGIVCVHQKPLLAPSISINENLKLGISRAQYKNKDRLLKQWLPELNGTEPVKNLNEKQCFYVALISALLKNPEVLILDEPPEISKERLQELAASGMTIIIITHNLQEALDKSNIVILLQDGKVLAQANSTQITKQEIQSRLYGIAREVQLPQTIQQADITEGEVSHCPGKTGLIPEDKSFTASNPELSIFQLLTAFHPRGKTKDLEKQALKTLSKADVEIKLSEKVSCLSGGMLQKLILERELEEKPETLYLFNPTHGLDVEATEKLYTKLEKLDQSGTKVIIGKVR